MPTNKQKEKNPTSLTKNAMIYPKLEKTILGSMYENYIPKVNLK
jgi:hypothetical protein